MPIGIYPHKRKTLAERFWPKVDKNGPIPEDRPDLGRCWIWQASINKQTGYGQIGSGGHNGKPMTAYHAALKIARVVIPEGLEPDHLCRVRACVRLSHLELVTHRENVLRGVNIAPYYQRAKTHCPSGHALSGENLVIETSRKGLKGRRCRACRDARCRAWRATHATPLQRAWSKG